MRLGRWLGSDTGCNDVRRLLRYFMLFAGEATRGMGSAGAGCGRLAGDDPAPIDEGNSLGLWCSRQRKSRPHIESTRAVLTAVGDVAMEERQWEDGEGRRSPRCGNIILLNCDFGPPTPPPPLPYPNSRLSLLHQSPKRRVSQ